MIRVRVSGGPSATREALLKDQSGAPLGFASREEAEAERQAYLRERNQPHATARFEAWIVRRASIAEWSAQEIAAEAIRKAQIASRTTNKL